MPSKRAAKADDYLDKLLLPDSARRLRKKSDRDQERSQTNRPPGLQPTDLLSLPDEQRMVLDWLLRQRKSASFEEIRTALAEEPAKIEAVLSSLRADGYLHEALIGGQVFFRVAFKRKNHVQGLMAEIWQRLEQDDTATFLSQLPLFRELPAPEIEKLADQFVEKVYQRNEVILWQGSTVNDFYIIKSGFVGITTLAAQQETANSLAYLEKGQILGEVGLLVGQKATATATALSRVQLLSLTRSAFFKLLNDYAPVATQLARILGQRLATTTRLLNRSKAQINLCVLVGLKDGVGSATLGSALALTLSRTTQEHTVYTHYPISDGLAERYGFTSGQTLYQHPSGDYDIACPRHTPGLLPAVQVTLVVDQLLSSYSNIIICLPQDKIHEGSYILERANQVIVMLAPEPTALACASTTLAALRPFIHPQKTPVSTILNHIKPDQGEVSSLPEVDFTIPFMDSLLPLAELRYDNLPQPLAEISQTLAELIGRTNLLSLYIPTTIAVDQHLDTSIYVDQALAFLGRLFGGATSKQAQGVWNSKEVGLVNEDIYLVQSFVTQADMDRHLAEVFAYVEQLKQELKQEAMALEINQQLILI